MKIYGINSYGGKSNSDIVIHASGEGFNELAMLCDAVLIKYKDKVLGKDYLQNTTAGNTLEIARELKQMMSPLNDNPKRLFTTI